MSPVARRLCWFYSALFLITGVQLPYWPLWLEAQGLGKAQVGDVIAVGIWIRTLASPSAAWLADRADSRRGLVLGLAGLALLISLLYAVVAGYTALLLVTAAFMTVSIPQGPLTESLTLLAARQGQADYGKTRLFGSASFLVMALVAGVVLQGQPASRVLWLLWAALGATFVAAFWLPDLRAQRAEGPARSWSVEVRSARGLWTALLGIACVHASHAAYYAFSTIHWRAIGIGEAAAGGLWAIGVLGEIVLFRFGSPLTRVLGVRGLLLLGAAGAMVRWVLFAVCDSPFVVVPNQLLHAFSFGATHLAAVGWIQQHVPERVLSTAQSLYSATSFGAGMGLAMLVAGRLYAVQPGYAFWAMSGLCLAGGLIGLIAMPALPRGIVLRPSSGESH